MGDEDEWRTLFPGRRADVVLDRDALAFDVESDPGFRVATPVSSNRAEK